jgi:serine/threonine protein kinase/dipeptidyl aminopeptidase/acylaminoacyl peptidase
VATKCPKCNVDNPDTKSFCGDCGTQLSSSKDIPSHTKTQETPFPQFSPGTSLAGRYEVIKELGKGGMGEVYLAEDTNLKRQVAIKVLPKAFSLDKERLTRFEREARLLASLSHPNIATIHGLEKSDGQPFLVMELVEGETLAERIKKGPIPYEEALDTCRQIAEGLESAHENGIIHRDLKPANLKITPENKVKILDFGLAKVFQEEPEAIDISKSPTLTDRMTQPGTILGTAAYMSPEQARSHPVDKRTDIWAFGCVLFECLTGKIAFQGETFSDTLAQTLKGEPDWTKLPSGTPYVIRALLRRCLQKDPRRRLHDIADARIEMQEGLSEPQEETRVVQRFSLSRLLLFGSALFAIGIVIGLFLMHYLRPIPPPSVVRSVIKLEPHMWLAGRNDLGRPTRTAMAISRDGRFLVYSAIEENSSSQEESQLYIRQTNQLEANPIPGTEGGICPFLSPDNRWIGFWADGKLMKISIDGGVPVELCNVNSPRGFTWGTENEIIFPLGGSSGLFRISAEGGDLEALTTPDKTIGERSHRLPCFLPNGRNVLFTTTKEGWDIQPSVAVLDLKTRQWSRLIEDASDARWVPSGHLVFMRQGTLMAVPFDLGRLEPTGEPVPIVTNVMQSLNHWYSGNNVSAGQFAVSDDGWLVYSTGGITPDSEYEIVWVDQNGTENPITPDKAPYLAPRLSPDGKLIAYSIFGHRPGLWVYDIARGIPSRLPVGGRILNVAWTPDGKRVVFTRSDSSDLFWVPVDSSSPVEILRESAGYPGSFSPDGSFLAYVESAGSYDIFILDLHELSAAPFLNTQYNEGWPAFSPDGRWLAYSSDESGRLEVYIRPFPGPGGQRQVSREGGSENVWSRDGKKLFYRGGGQFWVVDVKTDGDFSPSRPRLLFKNSGYFWGTPMRTFDVSEDGQFLMVKTGEEKRMPVTEMNLVQNWFEELKRLVPSGK